MAAELREPEHIEALEAEQETVETRLADPEIYRGEPDAVKQLTARLEELASGIRAGYERWEQLSDRSEEK